MEQGEDEVRTKRGQGEDTRQGQGGDKAGTRGWAYREVFNSTTRTESVGTQGVPWGKRHVDIPWAHRGLARALLYNCLYWYGPSCRVDPTR